MQLSFISQLAKEVVRKGNWTYLHYVANVEALNPLVLVEEAKNTPHVRCLLLLVVLDWEGNFDVFLLVASHAAAYLHNNGTEL